MEFSNVWNPNSWNVEEDNLTAEMYKAFAKAPPDGEFTIDALRFTEFQRGWKEAIQFLVESGHLHP